MLMGSWKDITVGAIFPQPVLECHGGHGCQQRTQVRVADLSQAGGQDYFGTPGSSIPTDQIEQILDPSVTAKGQGVSLGLVICRVGANAHTQDRPLRPQSHRPTGRTLLSRISRALDHKCRSHGVKTVVLALLVWQLQYE